MQLQFGLSMSFLPNMFGRQLRLHYLNVATSVEVVDHTDVKCYIFFGVTGFLLHGTGLLQWYSLKYYAGKVCSQWWIAEFVSYWNLFGCEMNFEYKHL